MTVKLPPVLSPVLGAGLPRESVPLAAAVQEPEAVPELKVQVKSAEAPGAKVATLAGVKLAQEPPPATLTFVIAVSPVFFSVTITVTVAFGATVVPGETVLVVSVVEG
jgi:hypothetical protein